MQHKNNTQISLGHIKGLRETAEKEKLAIQREIVGFENEIKELDKEFNKKIETAKNAIAARQKQIKELDDFIWAAGSTLDQLPKIEPALLRRGIHTGTTSTAKTHFAGQKAIARRGLIVEEAILMLQSQETIHVDDLKQHLDQKYMANSSRNSIALSLRKASKKHDAILKFLSNNRYALTVPAPTSGSKMNGHASV